MSFKSPVSRAFFYYIIKLKEMKNIVVILMMIVLSTTSTFAQISEKDLSRAEKKALRKEKEEKQMEEIIQLLHSKAWVIETHTVYDRYNQSYQMNQTLNFIGVKGEEGAIQLSFDGILGWNGVGGITLEGKVTSYEVKEGKKGNTPQVNLRFQGKAGIGSARINITVISSGQATARYSGDQGDRLTFSGQLVAIGNSSVYKGQSLF